MTVAVVRNRRNKEETDMPTNAVRPPLDGDPHIKYFTVPAQLCENSTQEFKKLCAECFHVVVRREDEFPVMGITVDEYALLEKAFEKAVDEQERHHYAITYGTQLLRPHRFTTAVQQQAPDTALSRS